MPIKSRWSMPIPEVSLPTYLFQSPDEPLPTQPILIDANRPDTHYLSLSTYRLWAKRFAVGLQKAGLKEGDRVLLFSGNNLCFPIVLMGILMAGGIFTGANPTYVARELAHQLRDSEAKFLITADASLETSLEAASVLGMGKERIFTFDDSILEGGTGRLGVKHWTTLMGSEVEGNNFRWRDRSPKETICCLNYSSGTTGVPKGVMITHYNYVANASQVLFLSEFRPNDEELNKDTRLLCFLPMYHALAQTTYVINNPKRGLPTYIMPRFDFLQMLTNIERFRITELITVPPIIVALTKHPAAKTADLSSIRTMLCGAAPLGYEVGQEAERLVDPSHRVNLKQGWGMTETTCSIMGWDPRHWSNSAAVGELLPNAEAALMNEDGTAEVPAGDRGELWVRAPNIMLGYWYVLYLSVVLLLLAIDGIFMSYRVSSYEVQRRLTVILGATRKLQKRP